MAQKVDVFYESTAAVVDMFVDNIDLYVLLHNIHMLLGPHKLLEEAPALFHRLPYPGSSDDPQGGGRTPKKKAVVGNSKRKMGINGF